LVCFMACIVAVGYVSVKGMECKSTQISERLCVTGPDPDGDYEIMIGVEQYTFISRAQADALIRALQTEPTEASGTRSPADIQAAHLAQFGK
jgi:hypothetical protein